MSVGRSEVDKDIESYTPSTCTSPRVLAALPCTAWNVPEDAGFVIGSPPGHDDQTRPGGSSLRPQPEESRLRAEDCQTAASIYTAKRSLRAKRAYRLAGPNG
ncbi:hypothetical protein ACTI_26240 [Actinoplanes sp. OR16]|nr:hypothetical protein ACTI_26240 [Actinoplanes sp. OR16]